MNDKNNFPTCPKCSGTWKAILGFPHYLKCVRCHLEWDNTEHPKFTATAFLGVGNHLSWHFDYGVCSLSTLSEAIAIVLPWMPYDITPEKIKLYLTFL